jgi:hypothetical protein
MAQVKPEKNESMLDKMKKYVSKGSTAGKSSSREEKAKKAVRDSGA